ncbi:mitochondrial carrier domain-containing protein [Rhodotorula diobovata]|uniref:Mitochondrial carrier domain-containing protein n=1 Tax=Rhodotorula diobovata TaxID=5288 RepID=A0A5C5FZJ5_9BASI|nr:mitochondrial carrier domain-containing protein [Rhodotorula diobovata]
MEPAERAAAGAAAALDSDSDGETNRSAPVVNDATADLIAGWLGGAVGVIVGNPFEVLKVRLQTAPSSTATPSTSSPRVGKSSVSPLRSPSFPFPPPPTPLGRSAAPAPLPVAASPAQHSPSTLRTPGPTSLGASPSATPQPAAASAPHAPSTGQAAAARPGLISLYRSEGIRFFFAGTAGPILGLAFIDSAFFGLYGRMMEQLHQDRQDPNALSRVFLSGATAGALCALLETPIEVVKTRAQVESVPGKKLGSFGIARQIARNEGLRGFYIGGLMTAVHDSISSGIFFWSYFVLRRLLRGDSPFQSAAAPASASPLESLNPFTASSPSSSSPSASSSASASPASPASSASPDTPSPPAPIPSSSSLPKAEVLRILLAGGLAGALSAIVPYPFDIVKTRLQTANFETRARTSPAARAGHFTSNATPFHTRAGAAGVEAAAGQGGAHKTRLTVPGVFRGIHADGVAAHRYRYPSSAVYHLLSTWVFPQRRRPAAAAAGGAGHSATVLDPRAEKWALRLLGLQGFATGIRPTVVSSFVGSAATITTVELALHLMGVNGGGGGVG